jgi:hypothetical protein
MRPPSSRPLLVRGERRKRINMTFLDVFACSDIQFKPCGFHMRQLVTRIIYKWMEDRVNVFLNESILKQNGMKLIGSRAKWKEVLDVLF